MKVIKAHIDTMRRVFRDKVTGDGGEIGVELMKELERAIRKYTQERLEEAAEAAAGSSKWGTRRGRVVPIVAPRD